MWNRKELKQKAKKDLKRSYWAAVGICFVLAFIGIEYSDSVSLIHRNSDSVDNLEITKEITNYDANLNEDVNLQNVADTIEEVASSIFQSITGSNSWIFKLFAGGMFILAGILSLLFTFGLAYPIMVGANRFFIKNQDIKASFLEIFSVFHYKEYFNIVYSMFCKALFTFVWSLLFIIPGIIKSYQNKMVPYILAENPSLKRKRVFEISKEMMQGQKWKAFVLDLSFILWYLLSSVTFGIVGIFFVNPYNSATIAQLYTTLKNKVIDSGFVKEDEITKNPFKKEEVEA